MQGIYIFINVKKTFKNTLTNHILFNLCLLISVFCLILFVLAKIWLRAIKYYIEILYGVLQ